ncbi:hypothetical protein Tdes44962_MAKER06071 [Teratosphaeria destructans]|uniref:F-box domain-containing protein n=1 Tax=Teratosphaeria destructans TaxID=418781 RepID=A0A9W7VYA4_9PEZI|nr:hypothetical protein Tdes44962_MAKER06071 [Teratosphaeria destructans]
MLVLTPEPPLTTATGVFRLLDLPPELRLRIYESALAITGVLSLTSTKTHRKVIQPAISPALLRTCKQIYYEIDSLLFSDNEICISVNAHDTCWPTIPDSLLPPRVLPKVQHLCVVLDCTNYFNASYADVDFSPFEALVSLKTLRIAMIYRKQYPSQKLTPLHISDYKDYNVVAQILERVPATALVTYGTVPGSAQHDFLQQLRTMRMQESGKRAQEAPVADLEDAGSGVKGLVRGARCGRGRDARLEGRSQERRLPLRL